MNKNQGATIGAILLAGLLFRPAGSSSPQQSQSIPSDSNLPAASQQFETHGEGPWIASCRYWAPARESEPQTNATTAKPKDLAQSLHGTSYEIDWHVWGAVSGDELGCKSDPRGHWGLPKEKLPGLKVKTIIATVPDPVHSHLALTFDRTIDALLEAAADNGYVSTYYWLPWRSRSGQAKQTEASANGEIDHNPERERQPGLIVLKYVPSETEETKSPESGNQVIYLFLVAETPTQGVDGFQLENAFLYEDDLAKGIDGQFSRGATDDETAIVGPQYSGSAASLRTAINKEGRRRKTSFEVAGVTGTYLAVEQLTRTTANKSAQVNYLSFDDSADFDIRKLVMRLAESGYDTRRFALLTEDNTALGNAVSSGFKRDSRSSDNKDKSDDVLSEILQIRFPREISLLRNAQVVTETNSEGGGSVPTPYLHLSLKDSSAEDSVPHFSIENTPLSQEAQLMAIARQLHRYRSQYIGIVASNPLDQIFLAQFLHRACPDARLVFFGGDLLMEREIDDVPFIGSMTVTPYNLIGLGKSSAAPVPGVPIRSGANRAYADSPSESFYNAASYTFGRATGKSSLRLRGYNPSFDDRIDTWHPYLWVTAIGADGYYPLGLLSPCASDQPRILPSFDNEMNAEACQEQKLHLSSNPPLLRYVKIYPSLVWIVLCTLISLLCIVHVVMLLVADYWSPFTRDLAIKDNDQPHRRSMYVFLGATMLFSMVFVIVFPVLSLSRLVDMSHGSMILCVWTLLWALLAVFVTVLRAGKGLWWETCPFHAPAGTKLLRHFYDWTVANACFLIGLTAWAGLVGIPVLWAGLCCRQSVGGTYSYTGLSFSYRCINAGSGVCPMLPVLLLLSGWYLWAFFQAWRLRFSSGNRPWLPGRINDVEGGKLFVSDDELSQCETPRRACLYSNITTLFITREVLRRFRSAPGFVQDVLTDGGLAFVYFALLIGFCFFSPIRSLDHFLYDLGGRSYLSSPYEALMGVLFFPLIAVALTGWLRMIFVWGALKRGLLERLESLPIRFAFNRLKGMGWMAMLRQGGLNEHWRDMARSAEAIRQILHDGDLRRSLASLHRQELEMAEAGLQSTITQLRQCIEHPEQLTALGKRYFDLMKEIELHFAEFARLLLRYVLIPYWKDIRTGLVEGGYEEAEGLSNHSQAQSDRANRMTAVHAAIPDDPPRITLAEEFVAIRYVSLIRAVLTNMRYLMSFASACFVLAIVAWNSYPFQPRQWVDWMFTALLLFLGSGIVWVFAQMYRNPILSRITETKANELGLEFYLRILSFGAIPVLTWLAYQFPDIASFVSKIVQPSVDIMK